MVQRIKDIMQRLQRMYKVKKDFKVTRLQGSNEKGSLVVQANRVQEVTKVTDSQSGHEIIEWKDRGRNNTYEIRRGSVKAGAIDNCLEPTMVVPNFETMSPWEVGRLCRGKVVGIDRGKVTLDGSTRLLVELAKDPRFRELAEVRETRHMLEIDKAWLAPFCGSRGKAGAQNFALQLLKHRNLLIAPELGGGPSTTWNSFSFRSSMGLDNSAYSMCGGMTEARANEL
jgi:hypothetical protein